MGQRATTILLSLGLLAVVLAALPFRLFELDRYFVPKELVLHVVALLGAVVLVARRREAAPDAVDGLLALFLAWSVVSSLFATNHWVAQRALGVSASSALLFWAARHIGARGRHRSVLVAAAVATVVAAGTGLAQAYGFDSIYFSQSRAPGGTFGNRNFVAHFAAIGLPALVFCTVTARRAASALAGSVSIGAVATLLVLTRTRAAWLAVAVSFAALLLLLIASRKYWRGSPISTRLAISSVMAVVGVAIAIAMPNRLNWRSDSPYLDSALGVVDYSSGSGRGRVAQYRNSMRMAANDPLFGVGPGNWPVQYVRVAPGGDPSLTGDGMTANPWPSSDWVAFASERGIVAAAALFAVFAMLLLGSMRRWSRLEGNQRIVVLAKLALAGTVVATAVVSVFDAVLLLPAPAFLAWTVMGAASGAGRSVPLDAEVGAERTPPPARRVGPAGWWSATVVATMVITLASTARSAAQVVAIVTVGEGGTRAGWVGAAAWDRGSYRIAMRAADLEAARGRGRCGAARSYAARARDLFPHAAAPRRLLRRCE